MFRAQFVTPLDETALQILLDALTALNVYLIRKSPSMPELYQSHVRYEQEKPGRELWLTIPALLRAGKGDCEDLACARAADLIARKGERARAFPEKRPTRTGRPLYHVMVQTERGIEDPSRVLGMKGLS